MFLKLISAFLIAFMVGTVATQANTDSRNNINLNGGKTLLLLAWNFADESHPVFRGTAESNHGIQTSGQENRMIRVGNLPFGTASHPPLIHRSPQRWGTFPTIPEPAMLTLLGVSLLILAGYERKRSSKKK